MWAVKFNEVALKSFKKLDKQVQRSIKAKLEELGKLEEPGQLAKPLTHDLKGRYRLHIGPYRVIFRLERSVVVILVVDVGKRESIYG